MVGCNLGIYEDDPQFLISMDLLFAIIPLTIVLGMVAADMGISYINRGYNISKLNRQNS